MCALWLLADGCCLLRAGGCFLLLACCCCCRRRRRRSFASSTHDALQPKDLRLEPVLEIMHQRMLIIIRSTRAIGSVARVGRGGLGRIVPPRRALACRSGRVELVHVGADEVGTHVSDDSWQRQYGREQSVSLLCAASPTRNPQMVLSGGGGAMRGGIASIRAGPHHVGWWCVAVVAAGSRDEMMRKGAM
jgi:hypothetical protein